MAIELRSWEYPAYLEEGLIDAVLARGPVWRDPATGQRAVVRGRAADLRGALLGGRPRRPKEDSDGRDRA